MGTCSQCRGSGEIEVRMKRGKVQSFPCPTCTTDISKIGRPIGPRRTPR